MKLKALMSMVILAVFVTAAAVGSRGGQKSNVIQSAINENFELIEEAINARDRVDGHVVCTIDVPLGRKPYSSTRVMFCFCCVLIILFNYNFSFLETCT